ncbi:MAG: enoyl-CoA hydratase [Pseudomonadota bacterium]
MFATDTTNRLFAAAFSLAITAAFMATAILPASPQLFA